VLSRLPRDSWPQMQLKCAAYEAFNRRRPDWGYTRSWTGDYLAEVIRKKIIVSLKIQQYASLVQTLFIQCSLSAMHLFK